MGISRVFLILSRPSMLADGLALQGGDRTLAEQSCSLAVLVPAFRSAYFVKRLESVYGYKAANSLRLAVYPGAVLFVHTTRPAVYAEVQTPTRSR